MVIIIYELSVNRMNRTEYVVLDLVGRHLMVADPASMSTSSDGTSGSGNARML